MDHDDTGPIADVSPSDSDVGRGISPWLVVGAIALLLALFLVATLLL